MPDRNVNQGEYARDRQPLLRASEEINQIDPTVKNRSLDRQLSVKGLLLLRLREGINFCDVSSPLTFQPEEIPLSKTKETRRVVYLSAIALHLAKRWQRSPLEIATQLVTDLQRESQRNSPPLLANAMPSGTIQLEVPDPILATWLQTLIQTPLPPPNPKFPFPSRNDPLSEDSLFSLQYSHARCCSLLRMAHREGAIVLADPNPEITPPIWQLLAPNPIPWLNPDQTLRLTHPAERYLLSQLLLAADALYEPTEPRQPKAWLKLANALSLAFQTFYAQCRMWGEVKTDMPELVQARLGLVSIAQSLLRSLLQDILNTVAPLEL